MRSTSSLLLLLCALFVCFAPAGAQELPEFRFNVASAIDPLPFRIVDAEFSTARNAIVAVSELPNQLHIYEPETGELLSVNLEFPPSCVSVSADGHSAVAGHDGWISHVDLDEAVLVETIAISTVVHDIVMGSGGWVYALSTASLEAIFSINVESGAYAESRGSIYGHTIARLHPGGLSMYAVDTSGSPADMRKFPIGDDGVAALGNDSPYHGDHPMCHNLWISADGGRIYTACGNVFRSSADPNQDMRYVGRFSKPVNAAWVAHTQVGNNLAVLPDASGSTADGEVRYFTPDFLLYRGAAVLPRFAQGAETWAAHGRWLFFNSAGTNQYVLVQAESASGMTNDFGVVTIDCTSPTVTLTPQNASISRSFTTAQFTVTGSSGCGWKSTSTVPWINTNSSGVGDGTVTYTVSANPGAAPRTGMILVGDATFTVSQAGLPAPVSFAATATSTTSVSLTWSSNAPAHHFEVWRNSGSGFTLHASPAAAFSDTNAANAAYVYKVRAVAADGVTSEFSAPDYAHTFTLTDPVVAAGMRIRAAHITELRTVVNTIRAAAGLGAVTFTDPSLTSIVVKRVHTTELHDAVNATRATVGMAPFAFSPLAANSVVRASAIESVRTSLR